MTRSKERPAEPAASQVSELDRAARERLERDWKAPMHERLARLHELCKQMTELGGAARPR